MAVITALNIYPVKSCAGIALQKSILQSTGLEYDRQWVVIDQRGRFVTQRQCPQMALIGTAIRDNVLTLTAEAMPSLDIPLHTAGTPVEVTVWSYTGRALDQGDAAAAWLSDALRRPVRLARFDPATSRLCNREFAGDSGATVLFADGYPLLILSEASLADLNSRLRTPLPMNRFRPNIVISGVDAFEEDFIDTLSTGSTTEKVVLKMVKPCVRCQITATDQASATIGEEPLHTLATYRMDQRLGGLTFGQNAIVMVAGGASAQLSVGQELNAELNF